MGSRETVGGRPGFGWLPERISAVSIREASATLAFLAAAAPFVARVAINGRAPVAAGLATRMDLLVLAGILGPVAAATILATTTDVAGERVGLAFVVAFGLLSLASPAAAVPAALGIVTGGTLAVVARWRALRVRGLDWRALPVGAIFVGIALSLGASMGVVPNVGRSIGAHLALLGAAATPALLGHGRRDWALGGVIAGLLVAVGIIAPFITGAVALVGGGIVAVSLPVTAAGLCGLVTTASAGVRTGHATAFLGAGLILVAGVPGTVPRALAAILGLLVLIETRGGVTA